MKTKIALLVILSLSAALSGCATTSTAYTAKYPLCVGIPAGFLGCK